MTNYTSLQENPDYFEHAGIPHQYSSEPTRSQWNHIEDLDSFFTRVYKYHQKHGFVCILLQEVTKLHQFVFVSGLTLSLMYAIDYNALFGTSMDTHHQSIFKILLPVDEVMANLPFFGWFLIFFLSFIFIMSAIRKFYSLVLYWDIKQFFNQALKIRDHELDNLTWHDVQKRLIQVQLDLQMCIHKRELTELDIYHRILRQENYLVALVNKKLLPVRANLPILGEWVYWTQGLRLNMMFLLFWSPWSPFENPWHLREEFKRAGYREKLAGQLKRQVIWLSLVNIIASPLVFIGQIIFYFFSYFELVRREPGKFGVRYWSHYGQLYLRHFNELKHELHARLTRAYRPATKYLGSFNSPVMVVLSAHIAFMCSSVLAIFIFLSFLDNEILYWDQVLSILAILTGVIGICRNLEPDETQIWAPEQLLQAVVLHTHYFPGDWQGNAHTSKVRTAFSQLFQYRFAALLEEFASPIMTPYFLLTYIYPRSLDLVDFFRNFTVSVVGVGDVCSFAQMDIRKHGNPEWYEDIITAGVADSSYPVDQYTQAEDGKVELSLMHFTATNPEWEPPEEVREFVENVNLESNIECPYPYGVISSIELGLEPDPDLYAPPLFDMPLPGGVNSGIEVRQPSAAEMSTRMSLNASQGRPAAFVPSPMSILTSQPSHFNFRAEGADWFSSMSNMRASTMILHNRHAKRHSGGRLAQSADAMETTPLLPNANANSR